MSKIRTKLGLVKNNMLSSVHKSLGLVLSKLGLKSNAKSNLLKSINYRSSQPLTIFDTLYTTTIDTSAFVLQLQQSTSSEKRSHEQNQILDALQKSKELSLSYELMGDFEMLNKNAKLANTYYKDAIIYSKNHRESNDLKQLLSQAAVDNNIIISQLAINYFPMLEEWLVHFDKFELKNLLIIALDPIVYKKAKALGLSVYHLPMFAFQNNVKMILWLETVKFRQRIIDAGVNYFHSDLDAFWLKNPYDQVLSLPGDIVASISYGTPKYIVDKWGFVACLGFYYMKSNSTTRKMYNDYVMYTEVNRHDQDGLNSLLLDNNTIWNDGGENYILGVSEPLDLNISVISDQIVTRDDDKFEKLNSHVFHPGLPGTDIFEKFEILRKYGIRK